MRRSAIVLLALMMTASPAAVLLPTASATNFAVLLSGTLNQTLNEAPAVALGPEGHGVAAWSAGNAAPWIIYASRVTVGDGWSRPVALSSSPSGFPLYVDAAASQGRYLAVVWGGESRAKAAVYDPAVGWSTNITLLNGSSVSAKPRVADAGNGSFAFLWSEVDGDWTPFTRMWSRASGWGPITRLDPSASTTGAADIAGDGTGTLIAAWGRSGAGPGDVMVRVYTPGSGWGALNNWRLAHMYANDLRAEVMDGNVALAWTETNGSAPYEPWAVVHRASVGWGSPAALNTTAFSGVPASIAVDGQGRAHALFQQQGGAFNVPTVRSYAPQGGWGAPVTLDANATGLSPQIVASASGFVRAVWGENVVGRAAPFMATFTPATGWVTPTRLSPETNATTLYTGLAADRDGNALTAWSEGFREVWGMSMAERDPPTISIASPQDRATINGLSTVVEIDAEAGSVVFGNGVSGTVPPTGHLTVAVSLRAGSNALTFEAVDKAGNRATASITVTAIDPTQTLLDTINATRAELDAAQAALNASQAQLAASQQAVANGTAATAALSAQLNTTSAALNQSNAAMEQLSLNFEQIKLDYNGSQADIADLEAALHNETEAHKDTKNQQIELQSWSFGLSDQLNLTSSQLNETRSTVQHQQSDLDFLKSRPSGGGAAASDSTALVLGVLGMSLGAAGLGASIMIARRGGGGGGGGGGAGSGELKTAGPSQAQQGAEPASKGGPTPHEPGPPPRPGGG